MVWSPLPLERVTIDGRPAASSSNRSGGWWLHAVTVEVPAGAKVSVRLDLAGAPARPGPYRLTILPGVGARPDEAHVVAGLVDGRSLIDRTFTLENPVVVKPSEER
jgi:hypothetical protein